MRALTRPVPAWRLGPGGLGGLPPGDELAAGVFIQPVEEPVGDGQGVMVRGAGQGEALLAARGFSSVQAGAVLTALIAGTALASLAVGRYGGHRSSAYQPMTTQVILVIFGHAHVTTTQ